MEQVNSLELLNQGEVPSDVSLLREVTTGVDDLTEFLNKHYLEEYIPQGGSKIKFLSGRAGSGKTHLARLLLDDARKSGYIAVTFSAKDVVLYDFREIYLEILRQSDLEKILQGCADRIIQEMGHDPAAIPAGKSYMDFLSERHEADALTKNSIRSILRDWFLKNPVLDNGFASCCSLLTGGMLGHPFLEASNRELLLAFMHGDKTIKLSQIRALGLSASRITKYNARHLLRSLAEVIHLSGSKGLLVVIDDMEMLLNRGSEGAIKYTKLRREDTYESIRQLIDDIDSMRYIMFVMLFDRELMDSENYGLKSYQALWMRIQNEVVGAKFNRFADILDLDRYGDQIYTVEALQEMAGRFCKALIPAGYPVHLLTREQARELIHRSEYGGLGLPFMVTQAIQFLNEEMDEGGGRGDETEGGNEHV